MTDYEYPSDEGQPDSIEQEPEGRGPNLPGGISVETAATGLLVIVLIALLWLFFGPTLGSDDASGLPTPTMAPGATRDAASALDGTPAGLAATAKPQAIEDTEDAAAATDEPGTGTSLAPAPGATSPAGSSPAATSLPAPSGLVPGSFTRVGDTDGLDLRFRFGPGTEYLTIRIAQEGEIMKVLAGPETADGVTWWRLQDTYGNVGWAAEDFLVPIAPPSSWNPPEASPTFPPGTGP